MFLEFFLAKLYRTRFTIKVAFFPLYDLTKKEFCFAILSFKSNPYFLKRRVKENL